MYAHHLFSLLFMQTVEVSEPPSREAGTKVESLDELIDKLKNEAQVL